MTLTRKFSQFVAGGTILPTDEPVGLEAGANAIWTGGGSGGSGGVTATFPQPSPMVAVGNWLKITPTSGLYALAQGDTPTDADVIGIVISANATTFTLQQSGYITTAMAVVSGLTPGGYFIDVNSAGDMVPNDAVVNGTVSRPVFFADSPTSGWVLPYRGAIVGGAAPSFPSGGSDSNLHTVVQTNTFTPGQVVRVSTMNGAGDPVEYTLAQADTLADAQAVGIVVANPAPSSSQFTVQFAGYNVGSLTVDASSNPLVPSTVYYLSPTIAGAVTSVDPGLTGGISKPIYVTEQATINLGVNAGYILPQRPLTINAGAQVGTVLLATLTASNQPLLQFNNVFSAAYNNYRFIWNNVAPSVNGGNLVCQIGTGSGPVYQTSNYSGIGYTVAYPAGVNTGPGPTTGFVLGTNQLAGAGYNSGGEALLTNVNSSNFKYLKSDATDTSYTGINVRSNSAQAWAGTTVLTSVQFFMNTGNLLTGTFSIYGINQ